MNYVPNESPQFAVLDPLVFFCVAAVVVTLWALGVAALVVARR